MNDPVNATGPTIDELRDRVRQLEDLARRQDEAMRLTREYVAPEVTLPPIPGWSWYDAHRAFLAAFPGASDYLVAALPKGPAVVEPREHYRPGAAMSPRCGQCLPHTSIDPGRIHVGQCAVCGIHTEVYDDTPRPLPTGFPRKRWWSAWR